ncbi:heavy metal translocating P-type ATPase [Natrialba hulunbeirensis JCM 10989]|uniref:Heavy metal translocating P-type ATPase n=1 Tax=Natrialba hulunbeirensis JCM 10989 TaxID=1227493 RepID=M0A344_9EURY|nr:cation-translocating P-type ATPase [Natrialba hulunbeirensis]ELY91773.1 heavy metal translocating P-type ATPase [Natrialba hulunbeirensis JCM 10989]
MTDQLTDSNSSISDSTRADSDFQPSSTRVPPDADNSSGDEQSDGCTLCSLALPSSPITAADVAGRFCCQGCLEVSRTLSAVETDEHGSQIDPAAIRERIADSADAGGLSTEQGDAQKTDAESSSPSSPSPSSAAEADDAFLAVEGMHCSTCEVFLESVAESNDGILAAEASYATETVRLAYDPTTVETSELPELISGYGYAARERGTADDEQDGADQALVKFLIGGGLFGMMVMVWYAVFLYPTYFGYDPVVDFGSYDGYYLAVNIWLLTTFVLFYTGYPILRGAFVSLRAGHPNMDLLVTTAAVGSYGYSTLAMTLGRTDLYFDVTVAVILAVTAGTYYEERIKRRAAGLLSDLTEQQVDEARRVDGETVPLESVEPGDHLLVRPGERVPLDGQLHEGTAAVDESLVTGESLPVQKEPGDELQGGTVVTDAPVVLEVGADATSTLDRLVSLLWSIQSARPGVQRLADKLATIFVPLVLVLAAGATGVLLATGSSLSSALLVGLTVVIVSCPCALGLATPLAIASGVQSAAKRGIVVAAETIFEDAPDVDIVVLDKTGTLTTGSMTVASVHTTAEVDSSTLHRRAAAVEALSEHPIAEAIVSDAPGADSADHARATVAEFERDQRGVSGLVDGERVTVGHPDYLRDRGHELSSRLEESAEEARTAGDVPVAVGWDGRVQGVLVVGDAPREEWRAAVNSLADGREVIVLTGDDGGAADRFREVAGVDEVFAGVPPAAKAETIRRLQSRGTVAMVGDGSNDAPALAAADIGIAMGSATKIATDAADAVIVSNDLSAVPETFDLAAGTHSRIRQNLGWAFVYNAIAIPLAVTGLLNPLFAALAMAASSALVVINSARSL